MIKKLTEEEYVERLDKFFPNVKLIGNYINHATKVLHRCLIHNCDWEIRPNNVLRGQGCRQCQIDKIKQNHTKTHKQYVEELKEKNPNLEVIGTYIKATTKITHRCKICEHTWNVQPNSLLRGTGCPVCSGSVCGGAPQYLNSIWSSEYKEFFAQYLTEEQMKTYMPHTNLKIDVVCPDCKKHKKIAPSTILYNSGIGCVCSDGVSYPNKFVYSVLDQLGVVYDTEHIFDWAKDKRYDIYIPSLSCIIENHGGQHYNGKFLSMAGKTLQEEQANDRIKQELAMQNNIGYYIILDCRESVPDWIKNSILNSQLNNLFDLSIVDFDKCGEFACSNLVKVVADLWNSGMSVKEIMAETKFLPARVQDYLRKSSKCNMCDWTPQGSYKRSAEMRKGENHHMAKIAVQCDKNNSVIKIWKYARQASDELSINEKNICACRSGRRQIAGGYRWYYLYDQPRKDGTIIPGAITLGLITEEEALAQLNTQGE
jgi:hypothetical protein